MDKEIEQEKPKRGSAGGKVGGKWKGPKGFAVTGSEKAREAGRLGGKKSKRKKKIIVVSA